MLATPIVVPPLSEQRRIVEILNEARDVRRLRQHADDLTAKLIPALFHDMFASNGGFTHLPELPIRKVVESAEYGTSTAANEEGTGIPILRMSNVTYEGELDLTDLKHIELPEKDLNKHRLTENDVLFNRTNSKELVGKTGLWDGSFEAVAASYFVRVRLDQERVDPNYFVAFLNLPSTKRRLQNMAKHAIGMSNINATELQRIRIPVPPIELQQEFGRRIVELKQVKMMLRDSIDVEARLTQSLLADAFGGELTADWREDKKKLLEKEGSERDTWLREAGVKLSVQEGKPAEPPKNQNVRHSDLSREQRELLEQIKSLELEDSAGTFTLSILSDELIEPLDKLTFDSVRRHLDVLAARGLIMSVSRRAGGGGSIGLAFGNAYRLPLNTKEGEKSNLQSDEVRMSELERLSRQRTS